MPLPRASETSGQSTVEAVGLALVVAALLGAVSLAGGGAALARSVARGLLGHRAVHQGDRWALAHPTWRALIARYAPVLVLERDRYGRDASVPVDFRRCRDVACAAFGSGRPVAFVHVLRRRPEAAYLEYWLYYPDSQTSHAPIAELRGYHADDWEGVVVRLDRRTGAASVRATAHGGFAGAGPWWSAGSGWRSLTGRPVVYRAAGSHANGFVERDVDLAGDAWNGTLGTLDDLALAPADEAPSARRRFSAAASPPWHKAAWRDPNVAGTGTDGVRGRLALAAALWAGTRRASVAW